MTAVKSAYLQTVAALKDVLTEASKHRRERDEFIGGELGWVLYERGKMHDAVNYLRSRRGIGPADPDAVLWAENRAAGHIDYVTIDYVTKYAIGCADLVHYPEGKR